MEGKAIVETVDEVSRSVTLGRVSANALLMPFPDEMNLAGEEKVKRFMIATKVWTGTEELTLDEIGVLKKCIGKAYAPLIVGRAWELLAKGTNTAV